MVTIKDVARDAGVSVGTVSNVLNGGRVSEARRKLVEASIEKLGYQVNTLAKQSYATVVWQMHVPVKRDMVTAKKPQRSQLKAYRFRKILYWWHPLVSSGNSFRWIFWVQA